MLMDVGELRLHYRNVGLLCHLTMQDIDGIHRPLTAVWTTFETTPFCLFRGGHCFCDEVLAQKSCILYTGTLRQ